MLVSSQDRRILLVAVCRRSDCVQRLAERVCMEESSVCRFLRQAEAVGIVSGRRESHRRVYGPTKDCEFGVGPSGVMLALRSSGRLRVLIEIPKSDLEQLGAREAESGEPQLWNGDGKRESPSVPAKSEGVEQSGRRSASAHG